MTLAVLYVAACADVDQWDVAQDVDYVGDARGQQQGESQHAHTATQQAADETSTTASSTGHTLDAASITVVAADEDEQDGEQVSGTAAGGWGQWWHGATQACWEAVGAVGGWMGGLWGGAAAVLACLFQCWTSKAEQHDTDEALMV